MTRSGIGYFQVGRFWGAPVRIHWTTPIGAYLFCGFGFAPVAWVAFVFLVLAHELGHGALVRKYGLQVVSVDVHALGGVCWWVGQTHEVNRAKIAWGGVLAQLVILVIACCLAPALPPNALLGQIVQTWTASNVLIMAINLLPIAPLDGAEAWTLFRFRNLRDLWSRGRRSALQRKVRRIELELERLRDAPDDERAVPPSGRRPAEPSTLN